MHELRGLLIRPTADALVRGQLGLHEDGVV